MMQVRVPVNGARRRSPMVLNSTGADPVWCKRWETRRGRRMRHSQATTLGVESEATEL